MSLPERLRRLRSEKKLTKKDVAQFLGVSERMIYYYETGEKGPDREKLAKLAGLFEVTSDYLITGKDAPTPSSSAKGTVNKPRTGGETTEEAVGPEQREFLKWVEENVSDTFFFDFDSSPEESKKQLMADLRYMWEREKKTGK